MNETQAPNNAPLYLKLATIMGEVGNIPKTGENAFFRYKFVTADAVADRVRDLLSLHKVAFFAAIVDRELIEVRKIEKNGEIKPMPRWVVTFEFTFADGESGATVTQRWVAEADSTDDKGINKCATAAQKYFLLKTFVVTSADEPDADASAGDARTPAARTQRPASASNGSSTPSTSNSAQNAPQRPKEASGALTERVTADALYRETAAYFSARPHFDAHWLKHQSDYTNLSLEEAVHFVTQLHWNYDKQRCSDFQALAFNVYAMQPGEILEALSTANGHSIAKFRDWDGGNWTVACGALLAYKAGYDLRYNAAIAKEHDIADGVRFEADTIAQAYQRAHTKQEAQ